MTADASTFKVLGKEGRLLTDYLLKGSLTEGRGEK
jgi:hypothetical protein